MKKIVFILLLAVILMLAFSVSAFAGVVTTATEAAESTAATTYEGYEPDMVRGQDITMPIIACFIVVCACIIYGIHELRKHKNDTL